MKRFNRQLISGGSFYIFSLLAADALNFIFSAFLGRVLTFEEFGLVTLINTLWTLVLIFVGGVGTTLTYKTAFLSGERGEEESISFYKAIFRKTFFIVAAISLIFLVTSPFISRFFDLDRYLPFILFAPLITTGVLSATNKGFLQGRLNFGLLGMIIIVEAVTKLLLAILLVLFHLSHFVYAAVIFTEIIEFAFGMYFVRQKTKNVSIKHDHIFPRNFFLAAITARLSTTSFLILDVVVAKHFLSPLVAGEYAFLALVGKMVFYFGSLLSAFIVSLVSREVGRKQNPHQTFTKLLTGTFFLTFFVYLFIGPLGYFTVPLLFGKKAYIVLPYLSTYGLAIAFYTITTQIVTYRLSRKHYIYPATALLFALVSIAGMMVLHKTIGDIVAVILGVSIVNFLVLLLMNLFDVEGKFVKRNIVDFLEIIMPVGQQAETKRYKKKILIFNWRDTKHLFAGGAEVYVHEMAKRWVKKGCKVTVFCGNDGKSPRHEIIDGVEIIRRGGFYFVYVWAFVYYQLRLRGKYDVTIDSENGIPFFTPLYVKEQIYCLMHHVHQDVFRSSLIKPLAMLATFLEKDVMPLVYKRTPFITVSESTKKDMEDIGFGKAGIQIVHPGVDLKELKSAAKSSHPTVLYLGRLKFYKSIHVLLSAAVEIIKKVPTTEIIIAGAGEDYKRLIKIAKDLQIVDHITFLGKVTEEEKISLYQRAWVFVNPSMMEGWGITTIEANACGTPIVASNVPGLRDAVSNPHSGFLVDYGNSNAFAEKILLLLKDEKLRGKMSQTAITWAHKFDWEKNAEKCLDIITKSKSPKVVLSKPSLHIASVK